MFIINILNRKQGVRIVNKNEKIHQKGISLYIGDNEYKIQDVEYFIYWQDGGYYIEIRDWDNFLKHLDELEVEYEKMRVE